MTNSTAMTIGATSVRQVGELYSLNDLHGASGGEDKHRPGEFMRLDQTQALIAEISKSADQQDKDVLKVGIPTFVSRKGRYGGTYGCKELVIAYAAWISAAFHLKVIRVFLNAVMPAAAPRNPAIDYDRISPAQAQDLKQIVEAIAKARVQGFSDTWSRLHRKFQVNSYLELPATRHLDARNYLLAKLPAPEIPEVIDSGQERETLNALIERLARQLDEPNGYHVSTFMPLHEVIVKRLIKSGLSPHLEMPIEQAKEVFSRINRLAQLFNPLSPQFDDALGVIRVLQGLDPKTSFRREGFLPLANKRMLALH